LALSQNSYQNDNDDAVNGGKTTTKQTNLVPSVNTFSVECKISDPASSKEVSPYHTTSFNKLMFQSSNGC